MIICLAGAYLLVILVPGYARPGGLRGGRTERRLQAYVYVHGFSVKIHPNAWWWRKDGEVTCCSYSAAEFLAEISSPEQSQTVLLTKGVSYVPRSQWHGREVETKELKGRPCTLCPGMLALLHKVPIVTRRNSRHGEDASTFCVLPRRTGGRAHGIAILRAMIVHAGRYESVCLASQVCLQVSYPLVTSVHGLRCVCKTVQFRWSETQVPSVAYGSSDVGLRVATKTGVLAA
eukprot:gene8390-biopygen21149